jgi:hypothetical protein
MIENAKENAASGISDIKENVSPVPRVTQDSKKGY